MDGISVDVDLENCYFEALVLLGIAVVDLSLSCEAYVQSYQPNSKHCCAWGSFHFEIALNFND